MFIKCIASAITQNIFGSFYCHGKSKDRSFHNLSCLTEPSYTGVFSQLLRESFKINLHNILLESAACEHAARMMAMDGATRNANDMVQKLQARYNQTRQAQITSQLIEVISAAQAV